MQEQRREPKTAAPSIAQRTWRKVSGMWHRSMNHSNGLVFTLTHELFRISLKLDLERSALLLCHVLQTLWFLLTTVWYFACLNVFLCRLVWKEIFMTEEASAMAGGTVFAGCLSVPLCRCHISGMPAARFSFVLFFFTCSRQK